LRLPSPQRAALPTLVEDTKGKRCPQHTQAEESQRRDRALRNAKGDRPIPATGVDPIQPHRGNVNLFYEPSNLASLCKHHHDRVTRLEIKWRKDGKGAGAIATLKQSSWRKV